MPCAVLWSRKVYADLQEWSHLHHRMQRRRRLQSDLRTRRDVCLPDQELWLLTRGVWAGERRTSPPPRRAVQPPGAERILQQVHLGPTGPPDAHEEASAIARRPHRLDAGLGLGKEEEEMQPAGRILPPQGGAINAHRTATRAVRDGDAPERCGGKPAPPGTRGDTHEPEHEHEGLEAPPSGQAT